MREELFNTYLKAHGSSTTPEAAEPKSAEGGGDKADVDDEIARARKRQEKKERAVKEREEKIRVERSKVEADIGRSRIGLNKEEGELEFRCAAYPFL